MEMKPAPGQLEPGQSVGVQVDTYAIDLLTDEAHGPLTEAQAARWEAKPLIKLLRVSHDGQHPPEKRRMLVCLAMLDTRSAVIH